MPFVNSLETTGALPEPVLSLAEVRSPPASAAGPPRLWRLALLQALPKCNRVEDMLQQLGAAAQELLPEVQLFYCARGPDGALSAPETCQPSAPSIFSAEDRAMLSALAQRACTSGRARFQALPGHGRCMAIATPVFLPGGETDALCAVGDAARDIKLLQAQLESLAQFPSFWKSWQELRGQTGRASAELMLGIIAALHAAPDLSAAAALLADQLQAWLGCQRVVVSLPGRAAGRLLAVSGQQRIDLRSEATQTLTSALDEIVAQPRPIRWTLRGPDQQQPEWPTLRRAAALTGATVVLGIPLRDENQRPVAALMLLLGDDLPPRVWSEFQSLLPVLSGTLKSVSSAHRTLLRGVWERFGGPSRYSRRTWLAAAAALMAILLLPIPFRPATRFTIEPVTRRFVAAPFPGVLERCLAMPGDLVEKGEVLARMDEQELRWELAGLEAEYNQAAKRYDTALATQSAAAVQLSKFEMEQFQTRIDTLEQRLAHLTIRSPLTGVVVRGDLERSEGAPLTIGQTLFEIAPLDRMVAELEVPEDEVSFVYPGQHIRLRLDADPFQVFTATVNSVHPRAELRHNRTVFIAEAHLGNDDKQLRPGMNGRATGSGPLRPLVWVLFRRPVNVFLQWSGW